MSALPDDCTALTGRQDASHAAHPLDVPPPLQPKGVVPGSTRAATRRLLPPPPPLPPSPVPADAECLQPLGGGAACADSRAQRSHYNHKALLEIRRSLVPFAHGDVSGRIGRPTREQILQQLARLGEDERQLLRMTGFSTMEELLQKLDVGCASPAASPRPLATPTSQRSSAPSPPIIDGHLVRKSSFEYDGGYTRASPALESSNASTRSESPATGAPALPPRLLGSRGYGSPAAIVETARGQTPPQLPSSVQQRLRCLPPAPLPCRVQVGSNLQPNYVNVNTGAAYGGTQSSSRGCSPLVVMNGPSARHQLTQQMQSLSLEPPPYPHTPPPPPPPPPSYTAAVSQRQSPATRHSTSVSPISCSSTGSVTPVSLTGSSSAAAPLHSFPAFQTKAHSPVIMQSVKSTHVQKPVLQTAVAPVPPPSGPFSGAPSPLPKPPTYNESLQARKPSSPACSESTASSQPPSYQETVSAASCPSSRLAELDMSSTPLASITNTIMTGNLPAPRPLDGDDKLDEVIPSTPPPLLPRKPPPSAVAATSRVDSPRSHAASPASVVTSDDTGYGSAVQGARTAMPPPPPPYPPPAGGGGGADSQAAASASNTADYKMTHHSPIPERRRVSKEREDERRESKVKLYSPQAFKFFMEQHVENLQKSCEQRQQRRRQLENEMSRSSMPDQTRNQIRRMLYQKESNFIRLKRAKMNRRMFKKIRVIGVGAFGEVSLVRKIDTSHLYAMKTLRKTDVLKRNQVAHVKAERDILAEAENEWVVKLYYSFQDRDHLYFVMDYIPGGDLMSLLIKFGIFQEPLARFYIVELTCALEYVHKMGFIHRDIKPDNILIDRDGHIKLTDFGLCTGFRWTHNSKYYASNEHARQDSMDLVEEGGECRCLNRLHAGNKPLERRRRREHQRCEAHSLVGTPNYIAPEVLMRTGYTQLCDWWSVGVILYEMLIGQPPFMAPTPAETQLKVINWRGTLSIPKQVKISGEARDLILCLLTDSAWRIGSAGGADQIKAHAFFSGVDFDGARRLSAPYVPSIRHPTDTSNFDAVEDQVCEDADEDAMGAESDATGCELLDHPGFFEFTFRRFFDGHGSAGPQKMVDGPVYV